MTKKSDAPAIRFKGFSDAWEQRKLGDLRYSILKMSCLKHLNMSIWSLLLAQRCCRIGLR